MNIKLVRELVARSRTSLVWWEEENPFREDGEGECANKNPTQ